MEYLIEALRIATVGRYRIFTEETEDCFEIICLDQQYNLVTNRQFSRAHTENAALMAAIYCDLRQELGCYECFNLEARTRSERQVYKPRRMVH